MSPAAQRFASQSAALGRGRRSRPTRKMKRRGKLLEIAAEYPASGARFVRRGKIYNDTFKFYHLDLEYIGKEFCLPPS